MMYTFRITAVAVLLGCLLATDGFAQIRAEFDRGATALARQLQRLQTTASVMHTGAHPDDEDSALVAYHARHDHARTSYLSLTRGSGGQNIIGSEQSDLLGVIRTEELLQARRLDGAGQLFTRAVDFGFSKNLAEGIRLWDEAAVLGDMVRAIRRFRPDVVVSRWNGTPQDGHGHHQFSGYLTPLALEAAADPEQYPEQIAEELQPWQVTKLYVGARVGPPSDALLAIDTGIVDRVAGRSYFQIGMRGRSQQKTQQMGSLELHGAQNSLLRRITPPTLPGKEDGTFSGIDTSLSAIARFEAQVSGELVLTLRELERLAKEALAAYRPLQPELLIPLLGEGLATARSARRLVRSFDGRRLLDEKIVEYQRALVLAAGITVDALSDRETVVPGDGIYVAVRLFGVDDSVAEVGNVTLETPEEWSAAAISDSAMPNELTYRRMDSPNVAQLFRAEVPAAARLTQPYWLERPRSAFDYDWSAAGDSQTLPFAPPLMTASVQMVIGSQPVTIERQVQFRYVDPVRGEVRRRLDVVPAVSVEPASNLLIIPATTGRPAHGLPVTVRNHSGRERSAAVTVSGPSGWSVKPERVEVSLPPAPASATVSFEVALPENVAAGEYLLTSSATVDGKQYQQTMHEISYPHIQTHRVYEDAGTTFSVIDFEVADVRIGYVMGSGDRVPEALQRLDLDVSLLDDEMLTSGDLGAFDTIVIGIRASQTRPAYVENNSRLHDFVRRGGTLIVQYQQPDFAAKNLAPFPIKMERNVRVVDETAPVAILAPGHPVFRFPNRIGPADFEGWVQERNNYNITEFDPERYVALTESHDPGEPESDGAMLYARIGEGHYVYTAYSWFRQLPNGTPGGYRIFANLLSLPAADWSDE